jgi:hypothetical protein
VDDHLLPLEEHHQAGGPIGRGPEHSRFDDQPVVDSLRVVSPPERQIQIARFPLPFRPQDERPREVSVDARGEVCHLLL